MIDIASIIFSKKRRVGEKRAFSDSLLDPALLRPGRFDRQLTVSLPNLHGRVKILEVHTRPVTISPALNLTVIAQGIPGFSGADIANLVNEAALTAARQKKQSVEMSDFEEAKDKIMMGLERKNAAINEKERRIIAYHEAGHAIVARLLPETDGLHKITIIPRGIALGLTQQVPIEERYTYLSVCCAATTGSSMSWRKYC